MDVLQYTRSELEKELVLLEKHLKQYPYMKRDFCTDCFLKHMTAIEGLSEEGVGFARSEGERSFFSKVAAWAEGYRRKLPNSDEDAAKAAVEARTMRKDVILSPLLSRMRSTPNPATQPESREKALSFLSKPKGEENRMAALSGMEAATLVLSGLGAKLGDRALVELDKTTAPPMGVPLKTWGDVGGGAGLMIGSFLGLKGWAGRSEKNRLVQLALFNAGENLFQGTVDVVEQIYFPAALGLRAMGQRYIPAGGGAGAAGSRGSYTITQ
jgi:hypothetical protein